jgi:hypothetical protein
LKSSGTDKEGCQDQVKVIKQIAFSLGKREMECPFRPADLTKKDRGNFSAVNAWVAEIRERGTPQPAVAEQRPAN